MTIFQMDQLVLEGLQSGSKNDGGVDDNWSCKMCKAAVRSSPPTNQHPAFHRQMPFLLPNQQCQSTEVHGKECDILLQNVLLLTDFVSC